MDEHVTERLLARPPRDGDLDGYRAVFLDPAVEEWLRPAPLAPFTDRDIAEMLQADRLHWARHGFGPWALLERDGASLIGRGGLRWTDVDGGQMVELPWTISSGHWSRGLASEAAAAAVESARALELADVVALIRSENAASRLVAERAGLRHDGEVMHAGLPHLLYRLT